MDQDAGLPLVLAVAAANPHVARGALAASEAPSWCWHWPLQQRVSAQMTLPPPHPQQGLLNHKCLRFLVGISPGNLHELVQMPPPFSEMRGDSVMLEETLACTGFHCRIDQARSSCLGAKQQGVAEPPHARDQLLATTLNEWVGGEKPKAHIGVSHVCGISQEESVRSISSCRGDETVLMPAVFESSCKKSLTDRLTSVTTMACF